MYAKKKVPVNVWMNLVHCEPYVFDSVNHLRPLHSMSFNCTYVFNASPLYMPTIVQTAVVESLLSRYAKYKIYNIYDTQTEQ